MTLTFNCSLKLILFHTRNCVDATMCSSPALLTLAKALLGRNAFMLHSEAKDEREYNMRQSGVNWTDQFCFYFFFFCSKPADQMVPQNPNVRWGHVFVSVQRLCGSFFRICFIAAALMFQNILFWCFFFLYLKLLCVVISQYAPLSLRPLTCEVISGHRWGPREQGCIQFQRPRKRSIFRKDDLIVNVLRLRVTFGCNMSLLVLSWWCQAVWNVSGDALAALWRV